MNEQSNTIGMGKV